MLSLSISFLALSQILFTQTFSYTCFKGYLDAFGNSERTKALSIDYSTEQDLIISCGCTDAQTIFGYDPTIIDRRPYIARYNFEMEMNWIKAYDIQSVSYIPICVGNCQLSPNKQTIMATLLQEIYTCHTSIMFANTVDGSMKYVYYLSHTGSSAEADFFYRSQYLNIYYYSETKVISIWANLLFQYSRILIFSPTTGSIITPSKNIIIGETGTNSFFQSLLLSNDMLYLYVGGCVDLQPSLVKLNFQDFSVHSKLQFSYTGGSDRQRSRQLGLKYDSSTKTEYILACNTYFLAIEDDPQPEAFVFLSKDTNVDVNGGNGLQKVKLWQITNNDTPKNTFCGDVYMEDFTTFYIFVYAIDQQISSYILKASTTQTGTFTDTTTKLLNYGNVQTSSNLGVFVFYIQAARLFNSTNGLLAGRVYKYRTNTEVGWLISMTYPMPDFLQTTQTVSLTYVVDSSSITVSNSFTFPIRIGTNARLINYPYYAVFSANSANQDADLQQFDTLELGTISMPGTKRISYLIGNITQYISFAMTYSISCTFDYSNDFSYQLQANDTSIDVSKYLSYNGTHFALYTYDYSLQGKYIAVAVTSSNNHYSSIASAQSKIIIYFWNANNQTNSGKTPLFTTSLINQVVAVGEEKTYYFPNVYDPENPYNRQITLNVKLSNGSQLPQFLTYTNKLLKMKPNKNDIGEYNLIIALGNQYDRETTLKLTVLVYTPKRVHNSSNQIPKQDSNSSQKYNWPKGCAVSSVTQTAMVSINCPNTIDKQKLNSTSVQKSMNTSISYTDQESKSRSTSQEENYKITYQLLNIDNRTVTFKLTIDPKQINSGSTLLKISFLSDSQQYEITYQVPPQISEDEEAIIYTTSNVLINTMKYLLFSGVGLSTLSQISLRQFWGFFNSQLLIQHLPLFNLKLPGNLNYVFQLLSGPTLLQIFSSTVITEYFFQIQQDNDPLTKNFADFGYDQSQLLFNTNFAIYYFIAYPILIGLYFLISGITSIHKNLKSSKFNKPNYYTKYSTFYEYLDTSNSLSLHQNEIYFVRRAVFILTAVLLYDHLSIQLALFNLMSLLQLAFIGLVKPFDTLRQNMIEMFNEFLIVVISDTTFFFTDYLEYEEARIMIGYFTISLILMIALVNACQQVISIGKSVCELFLKLFIKIRPQQKQQNLQLTSSNISLLTSDIQIKQQNRYIDDGQDSINFEKTQDLVLKAAETRDCSPTWKPTTPKSQNKYNVGPSRRAQKILQKSFPSKNDTYITNNTFTQNANQLNY